MATWSMKPAATICFRALTCTVDGGGILGLKESSTPGQFVLTIFEICWRSLCVSCMAFSRRKLCSQKSVGLFSYSYAQTADRSFRTSLVGSRLEKVR